MQTAITTPDLFRLLSLSIGKENPATPYMVAKVFGVSPNTAGFWKKGVSVMDEANAEKAADMLGLDLDFVILSLQAERASKSNMDKMAGIFQRAALAAQTHGTRAASVFVGLAALPLVVISANNVCILCKTWSAFKAPGSARFRPAPTPFAA